MMSVLTLVSGKEDRTLRRIRVSEIARNPNQPRKYFDHPVNQIVGYIMSGDPTYITSHKNARSMIMKVERDELVEELLKEYIKNRA